MQIISALPHHVSSFISPHDKTKYFIALWFTGFYKEGTAHDNILVYADQNFEPDGKHGNTEMCIHWINHRRNVVMVSIL